MATSATNGLYIAENRSDLNNSVIPAAVTFVMLKGYGSAGDGGGALYRRNSSYDQTTDASGGSWGLDNPYEDVDAWGAFTGRQDCQVAIQKALDATGQASFRAREYSTTGTLFTGGPNQRVGGVALRGKGPELTRIIHKGTGDFLGHGAGYDQQNGNPYSPNALDDLTIEGFSLVAAAGVDLPNDTYPAGDANAGANVHFQSSGSAFVILKNGNYGRTTIKDIVLRSWDGRSNWTHFIYARGATLTNIVNCQMDSGGYASRPIELQRNCQIGLYFSSPRLSDAQMAGDDGIKNKSKMYVVNIDNTNISCVRHAVYCEVQGENGRNGSIEGLQIHKSGGRTSTGPWLRVFVEADDWFVPYFTMSHCNMEGPGSLIQMDKASHVHISHCLQFLGRSLPSTPTVDYIRIGRAKNVYIHDNSLVAYAGSRGNAMISIGGDDRTGGDSDSIHIHHNTIRLEGDANVAYGIWLNATVSNLRKNDNVFTAGLGASWAGRVTENR